MRALRKWWLKAGVQGVVSLLPERASESVNGRLPGARQRRRRTE